MGHRRKPLWMCTMYVRTLASVLIEEYQYQYIREALIREKKVFL